MATILPSQLKIPSKVAVLFFVIFIASCGDAVEEASKIETRSPVTSIEPALKRFYKDTLEVKLSCWDDNACAATYYTTTDASPLIDVSNLYTGFIPLDNLSPQTTIKYVSVDRLDNIESPVKQATFIVDATIPTVSIDVPSGIYNQTKSVTITCSDGEGAGCKYIRYALATENPVENDYIEVADSTITVSIDTQKSVIRLWYYAMDNVGNLSSETPSVVDYQFDTTKPEIVSTSPLNGDVSVNTDVIINVQFSENILPDSINEQSIVLSGEGANIVSTFNYDTSTNNLIIKRIGQYSLNTRYNLSINDSILDLAMNPLAQNYELAFNSRDGIWTGLDNIGIGLDSTMVGLPNGEAISFMPSLRGLYLRKRLIQGENQRLWGNDILVAGGDIFVPEVSSWFEGTTGYVNDIGEIFVVTLSFTRSNPPGFYPDKDFVGFVKLSPDLTIETRLTEIFGQVNTSYLSHLKLVADKKGNAIAFWQDFVYVWVSKFDYFGTGWSTPKRFFTKEGFLEPIDLELSISDTGDVYIIFQKIMQQAASVSNVARINMITIPSIDNLIDISASLSSDSSIPLSSIDIVSSSPKSVIDESGNIMLFWAQGNFIKAKRFINDGLTGWSQEAIVQEITIGNSISNIDATIDALGNIFVVWQELEGTTNIATVWSNRLVSGWTNPLTALNWKINLSEKISGNTMLGNSSSPKIGIDDSSNVLAVWRQDESAALSKILSNRLTSNWIDKPAVDKVWNDNNIQTVGDKADSTTVPKLTIDSKGRALILWNQLDASGTKTFNVVSKFE